MIPHFTLNSKMRPIPINLILISYTIEDLKGVYAEAMGIEVERVFCSEYDTDTTITLATQESLDPIVDVDLGLIKGLGTISTFSIDNILKIDRDTEQMYIIAADKSIYEPLFTAFTDLLGIIRRKKLRHLL